MNEYTYKHGAYAEIGESEYTPAQEAGSVLVALVTAPVNLSSDPQVNTPVRIKTKKEAVEFGLSKSEDFTSNKMIEAALDLVQVAPIYLINVLDPEKHKGESVNTNLQFIKGWAKVDDDKAIVSSIQLEDRTLDTDYEVIVDEDGSIFFHLLDQPEAGGNQEVILRPQNAQLQNDSGITLDGYELKFTEGKTIDPSLLHEDYYYAALQFPKPEGAVSLNVYRDGEVFHEGVNLTKENSDEDSVFDGVYHIYIKVADKEGKRVGMESYDFDFEWFKEDGSIVKTNAVINRLPANSSTGNVLLKVAYDTVDPSQITKEDLIGNADDSDGEYIGLQSIRLLVQKYGLEPQNISLYCPVYGEDPEVYQALLDVSPLNGHYRCYVYADIPLKNQNIKQAVNWKLDNFDDENSSVFWPYVIAANKKVYPTGMIAAVGQLALDASNGDVPFISISNKDLPIIGQYFGENTRIKGFDQHTGNQLNEQGIVTNVFYGGRQVLWGNETANVKDGEPDDPKALYATTQRTLQFLVNDFQNRFANRIDGPLSRSLIGEILAEEQIYLYSLQAINALYGVEFGFHETKNSNDTIVKGHFYFKMKGSPALPVQYLESTVSYTDEYYSSLLSEE